MSVVWERLAGDTNVFAMKVAFHRDPHEGEAATPEESVSWGSFQIWVRGENLCSHRESGELVQSVHWYQLRLLEWLARNWDALFHEERLPLPGAGDDALAALRATRFPPPAIDEAGAEKWDAAWWSWWRRHALQSCRDGGLFPEVFMRRYRDKVEVAWGRSSPAGCPGDFRFLVPFGQHRLEPLQVARPIFDVLKEASNFLLRGLPESGRFRDLCSAVDAVQRGSKQARLVWLASLGDTIERATDLWRRISARLLDLSRDAAASVLDVVEDELVVSGSCHASLMFGSVAPTINEGDIEALARAMVQLYDPRGESARLMRSVREVPVEHSPERPWEQGYRLAEEFLDDLGLSGREGDAIDVQGTLERLGVDAGEIRLRDAAIRAVAIAGNHHRPAILCNPIHEANQWPSGRRFTLAHELCHLLFDRSHGRKLSMASGRWAPRDIERRANAFAAMFLMPPELVRRALRGVVDPANLDEAIQMARSLRVSVTALSEHLCNLGFLDETARDRIQGEMARRAAQEVATNPAAADC